MIERTCKYCHKTFRVRPYALKTNACKYCSHQCYWNDVFGTAEERFWKRVQKTDTCWIWTGRPNAYGRFRVNGKNMMATHFSWELHYGEPVPSNLLLCHKCDNPPCVRPDHLFLGTITDNMRDASVKGRLVRPNTREPRYRKFRPNHHLRNHPERNPSRTHPETRPRGEQHHMTKLTWEQVDQIRALYASGNHTFAGLGRQFGMTNVGIANIVKYRTWKEKYRPDHVSAL